MEDLLKDHLFAVISLMFVISPVLIAIGKLIHTTQSHSNRLDRLEKEKVDSAICGVFHQGLSDQLKKTDASIVELRKYVIALLGHLKADDQGDETHG